VDGTERSARQLADLLRGRIHRGEMGPGDRLASERELAAQNGVSRLLVRDALANLEDAGYVITRRGATGGRFVSSLDAPFQKWAALRVDDLDDIIDFRMAVECQAVRFAAVRRTKSDLTAIAAAQRTMEKSKTPRDYRLADVAFHAALAAASKSARLAASVERARGELFEPTDEIWDRGLPITVSQHDSIAKAVAASDPDGAAAAMVEHIESTRREIHQLVRRAATRPARSSTS
jgi:GntR family transcriptional regulator, transcriptional repressor for pyruvate dehydrogenase complex